MENYGILLVDDEAAYQAILSAVLEPRGGHVEGVGDTAAAVDAARSRSFDLVLVDIQLAAGDGYETPGEIRRAADWARAVPMLASPPSIFPAASAIMSTPASTAGCPSRSGRPT